jgi:hypothetical protein
MRPRLWPPEVTPAFGAARAERGRRTQLTVRSSVTLCPGSYVADKLRYHNCVQMLVPTWRRFVTWHR